MKKIIKLFAVGLFAIAALAGCGGNNDSSTSKPSTSNPTPVEGAQSLRLHYYRVDEEYEGWSTWLWPSGCNGGRYYFTETTTIGGKIWTYIDIDLTQDQFDVITDWSSEVYGVVEWTQRTDEEVGFLIRDAEGNKEKNGTTEMGDRFIDLTRYDENGVVNAFAAQGTLELFYDVESVSVEKISTVAFETLNKIQLTNAVELPANSKISVTCGGRNKAINTEDSYIGKFSASITLADELEAEDIVSGCEINIENFGNKKIELSKIFTDISFNEKYTTDEELGVIFAEDNATFKLWTPFASKITLNLFDDGKDGNAFKSVDLTAGEKGVWSTTLPRSEVYGKYYTYDVTINGKVNKNAVDPYAVSLGENGNRGMVLDLANDASLKPLGWDEVTTPTTTSSIDAIVYEMHVRDLTMHETWNGSEANRGKFLGLCEEGTTYNGKPTGFDYIKQLGVTHIQLQPIYDFNSVNESLVDEESYKGLDYNGAFNWGYDPKNYAAPEGSYSSNPNDGTARVKELREVSKAYNNAGIGIIMDVVFNHMPDRTNLDKIAPGYYYRGLNNSGAGHDMASERVMYRKYMADITAMWTKEYKLSGFRFDLMGLHDNPTMRKVADEVRKIKSDAIIYGEAWTMYGGDFIGEMATQNNLGKLDGIGGFNDKLRDGIRGSVFNAEENGWVSGNVSKASDVMYGIAGTHLVGSYVSFDYNPEYAGASISYAECHDNLTLFDKLQISNPTITDIEVFKKLQELSYGIVFTSQGTPFLQLGTEMMRSKEVPEGMAQNEKCVCSPTGQCFNQDSYNASDKINAIDWSLIETYEDVVNAFKAMMQMRRENVIFRSQDIATLKDRMTITKSSDMLTITQKITATEDEVNAGSWSEVVVVYNANTTEVNVELGDTYSIGYLNGTYKPSDAAATDTYTVPAQSMVVFYK